MKSAWKTLVRAADLAAALEKATDPEDAPVLIDCRFKLAEPDAGEHAYVDAHIPGAVYAHLDRDLSGRMEPGITGRHPLPEADRFAQRLSAWGVSPDRQIVAYDASGGAIAARLWWLANWVGHEEVAVLDGGWPAWIQAGYPTSTTVPKPEPARFVARVRPDMEARATEVERAAGKRDIRLYDARATERYRGDMEPIDPVAGHIPGARSLPYGGNLGSDGRFLPVEALRERYKNAGISSGGVTPVFYCGSGVTAAHNVLSMRHAELGNARLYAGSWSEWITNPQRPVAIGGDQEP